MFESIRISQFKIYSNCKFISLSTLKTSLPLDLIKAKVLSGQLVLQQRVKNVVQTVFKSDKAGFFSNKKYDSYKCWSFAELFEAFTVPMENINVQFDCMVYQLIVGIPMGTNCTPHIAD